MHLNGLLLVWRWVKSRLTLPFLSEENVHSLQKNSCFSAGFILRGRPRFFFTLGCAAGLLAGCGGLTGTGSELAASLRPAAACAV